MGAVIMRGAWLPFSSTIFARMAVCFQLTLVRHGETEANRLRLLQGQQDNVLSDHGRQQARQVAARLAREPFTAVYSSDLLRASENHSAAWDERHDEQNRSTQLTWLLLTADIIATELDRRVEVVKDPRLRERGFGEVEGRPVAELVQAARHHQMPVNEYTPPGGETLQQLYARTEDVWATLCSEGSHCKAAGASPHEDTILWNYLQSAQLSPPLSLPSSHILVVSHGGLIHALMSHMCRSLACDLPGWGRTSPNTGVSSFLIVMETERELKCVSVTALCMHDTSHL